MKRLLLTAFFVFSFVRPVVAPAPVPFVIAWHLYHLGVLSVSTLVSHPVAVGVKTYIKTQGKDILKKPSLWTLLKAFWAGFTARKSWVRPYGKLWRVLHPGKDPGKEQTRTEALTLFVSKHKAFSTLALMLLVDLAAVAGLYIRHQRAQKAWDAEQKK